MKISFQVAAKEEFGRKANSKLLPKTSKKLDCASEFGAVYIMMTLFL
jgi:hypothetical protein